MGCSSQHHAIACTSVVVQLNTAVQRRQYSYSQADTRHGLIQPIYCSASVAGVHTMNESRMIGPSNSPAPSHHESSALCLSGPSRLNVKTYHLDIAG
jgi:hypothetical protein